MTRQEYLDALNAERQDYIESKYDFEGNAWDFLGQAAWGFTEQATLGALSVSDAVAEATRGDAANTWEEMIAGDAAGSWEELSDMGKAGYSLGAAFGQIPSFWLGGAITTQAVKGAGKVGSVGLKMAVKKSSKELAEEAAKLATKKGVKVSLTDDVARTVVDDAYNFSRGANELKRVEGNIASELYERAMIEGLRDNIGTTLKIADKEMLESITKTTFDIITKNNPDDALSLLQMATSRLPGLRNRKYAPLVLGSMGYDASIGLIMGTMRTATKEFQSAMWNVSPNEYGEMERSKDKYRWDTGEYMSEWWKTATHEAMFFAPLGAAKFVKGGTSANHIKRLTNGIRAGAKSYYKPLKDYTNLELRSQLTAMNEIAGGYLNIGRKATFEKLGAKWWVKATSEADTKLMKDYLGELRKEYVTKAPYYWAKEFGKDMIASLPRMATGVMAMHGPHILGAFKEQGFSAESLSSAMGESMPEVAANIFTAMYFTRQPHSFNVEASPGMFSKMFETGKIREYYGAKQSKLRKIIGGLNTFGVDQNSMMRIVNSYGYKTLEDYGLEQSDVVLNRAIDSSKELREIKEILSPMEGKAAEGGAEFRISFNKKISDMVKNGDITYEESLQMYDKLFVAEKILDIYNQNSSNKIDLDNISPEDAYRIANDLSSIRFNGEKLNKYNPDEQITSWVENTVREAVKQPQEILKKYIVDTYAALGITGVQPNEFGVIKAPSLESVDFGNSFVNNTFSTIYKHGIKNNWIDPQESPSRQLTRIDGEQQTNVRNAHDQSSERMMNLVYGEGWQARSIESDPLILTNDAWHITYNDYLRGEQRRNAYELLTGGKEHNTTSLEANDFIKSITDLVMSRDKPKVTEQETAEGDYGELSSFVDNLHEVVTALNPNIQTRIPKILTQEQASGLMEKTKSLMGDVMTDVETFKDFKKYIFNKSLQNLGLNDMNTGVDVKASILSLRNDIGFNYQDKGTKLVFPDRNRIASKLQTAKEAGKISEEAYKELLSHYDNVVDSMDRSRFPVEFTDDAVEVNSGDWIKALTRSLSNGENAMDMFSNDKARQNASFLENEADKLNMLRDQIALGADDIDPVVREKVAKQMEELGKQRDVTISLAELIKVGLTERNKALLDAVARKEGDIHKVVDVLSRDPFNSDRSKYLLEMVELEQSIRKDAQQSIVSGESVRELIRNELAQYAKDIPDKDLQETNLRVTSSQFQIKYNISKNYIDKLFDIDKSNVKSSKEIQEFAQNILGDYYDLASDATRALDPALRNEVATAVRTLQNLSRDIQLTNSNFQDMIVRPLKLAMHLEMESLPFNQRVSQDIMDADLYSISSAYFSKTPVKTLKVDLSTNQLILSNKVIGDVDTRSFMGIISRLDPGQKHIYLAETSGLDVNGKVIRDINGYELELINGALGSGNMIIDNPQGKADFYKHGDPTTLKDVDTRAPEVRGRYRIVPINESTSLIVRMDKGMGSIREQIQAQFNPEGDLFKMLEATFDGDLSGNQNRTIRDILERIRSAKTDVDVVEAVKMTRLLLDMPHAIERVIDTGQIALDHPFIRDTFKRMKLVEPKNGFIPTDKNIGRFANMYRNAESELHNRIYNTLDQDAGGSWVTPDANGEYRKLKTLSINDEASLVDANGNAVSNIFDSLARARVDFDAMKDNGTIDQDTYNRNIELIGDATKSIVDGEMFLSKNAYLMAMSMIGTHPDMVRVDANGDVIGFRSGGIKPTVSFSNVDIDRGSADYGRVQSWFGKTAFKYNPLLDVMMENLGIDALTFKSGNKINTLKERAGQEYNDMYADIIGTNDPVRLSETWDSYLPTNIADMAGIGNRIMELPWESMSLRTISKEHDPLVGANTGVHFSHDNGIAQWIGVDAKIDSYNRNLANMMNNPFYRTALAQRVLGSQAEAGDPSVVNSAISSILARDGIIVEPWAQRRLEDAMIGYFINNGGIAGGIVPNGSLDIMSADMGNLAISVRSAINGRPTVQYFGEFLPSYYAAQKKFIKHGQELNGVENVLIQKVKYNSEEGQIGREAEGFVIQLEGEKFLQIEGRAIDKEGRIRDLDTFDAIGDPSTANRTAYRRAVNLDKSGMDLLDFNTSLADAALILEGKDLSVGMLNSRQPRNMIGDIVISKMGIAEGADGIRRAHVDEAAGNVSRMNHMDAIKPQDADFDLDKSFNFVAAPGLFWREANKAAGHITSETVDGVLNKLFDPNLNTGRFAKTLPDLLGANATNDQILHEVNKARGQFVKMHQTATYLSNIFRQHPQILEFETSFKEGQRRMLQVRLSQNGSYVSTVDNISLMAKEYIDVYKHLPSKGSTQQIRDIQNQIFFGPRGIFEVVSESQKTPGQYTRVEYDLTAPGQRKIVESIRARLLDPLNRYLKYNRGVYEDPSGIQFKATLKNYNDAFVEMYHGLDPTNRFGVAEGINMDAGLTATADYFKISRNPYDVAMRGLHDVHQKTTTMKEQGRFGKGVSEAADIIEYIENGYVNIKGKSEVAKHNRIFNMALKEYVLDEGRMLRLNDLAKQEMEIKLELENKQAFVRGDKEDSIALQQLNKKLARVQELKTTMEEALSYKFKDTFVEQPEVLFNPGYSSGFLFAKDKPYVIVDRKGEIKEVIPVGKSNFNKIYTSDKIVKNGKRFEVTNGEVQKGLRVLSEAFSGMPVLIDVNGDVRRITRSEYKYIVRDYKAAQAEIINLDKTPTREGRTKYALERERVLFDTLFNHPKTAADEGYRKALILQMLNPEVSDRVVSVRSLTGGSGKRAVYDYLYMENGLSEPIISLLSKIQSGEHKGDKIFAKEMLDQIELLKTVSLLKTENSNIDFEIVKSRMFTEPASTDGFMTKEKYLNQDIYDKTGISDEVARTAAQIMVNYANGHNLIDPVTLYKASREMARKGIDYREQWTNEKVADQDGKVRDFGVKRHMVSEVDALNRKDLGEKGGQGQRSGERIRNLFDCYRSK